MEMSRNHIEKLCSFYVSDWHLVTMLLPYINKQINEKANIITILESDIEEKAFQNDDIEQLYKAFAVLTEEQKWLVEQVYYHNRKQSEIAAELGIDATSIRDRLRVIYKKIKNFFNK